MQWSIKNKKESGGFSLIELSVVIVIISLIVSLVSASSVMMKSSQIRSILSNAEKHKIATENFKDKYKFLPGDMINAHEYWDDGSDTVCGTAGQCNGDGDFKIEAGSNGNDSESLRFWQHLSLSDFVDNLYSGTSTTGIAHIVGQNCPLAPNGGCFYADSETSQTMNSNHFGLGKPTSNNLPWNGYLSPADALESDIKGDDGDPDNGSIQARSHNNGSGWTSSCLTGTPPSLSYDIDIDTDECILIFKMF